MFVNFKIEGKIKLVLLCILCQFANGLVEFTELVC